MLEIMRKKAAGKRLLYTICFFWFCLIDQRVKTCTGHDSVGYLFTYSLGIVMSILVLSSGQFAGLYRYFPKKVSLASLLCVVLI